jgi:hypothetical protein
MSETPPAPSAEVLEPLPIRPWPYKRVSWDMCWRGNPCRQCQWYGTYEQRGPKPYPAGCK